MLKPDSCKNWTFGDTDPNRFGIMSTETISLGTLDIDTNSIDMP